MARVDTLTRFIYIHCNLEKNIRVSCKHVPSSRHHVAHCTGDKYLQNLTTSAVSYTYVDTDMQRKIYAGNSSCIKQKLA